MPGRGAFIVLEGIDRCGKSTTNARLTAHLNKVGCRIARDTILVSVVMQVFVRIGRPTSQSSFYAFP